MEATVGYDLAVTKDVRRRYTGRCVGFQHKIAVVRHHKRDLGDVGSDGGQRKRDAITQPGCIALMDIDTVEVAVSTDVIPVSVRCYNADRR